MHLRERVGAWLTSPGCFFRVWAPHANAVTVLVQDGPYWEVDDTVTRQDLVKDGDYWSGTVPGVRAWQLYRFEISHPAAGLIQRLDPAARDVLSSELTRSAIPHEDHTNQVLGFVRQLYDNVVLTVVNLSEQNFIDYSCGVRTGGHNGQWTQILCTQDTAFGGWDGAGNAFHEPWTQADGYVYINLPKWRFTASWCGE